MLFRSTAEGAIGIAPHFDFTKLCFARVEVEHAIRQRPADAQDELQRFRRLNRPDNAGQDPDDTSFLTGGNQTGRWRSFEHAAIAGRLFGDDRRDSAVETQDAAMHQRFAGKEAGVIDEKLGRKIIDAVDRSEEHTSELQSH